MKIIELTVQNFKRIKALTIHCDEHVNSIGGNNDQGKSSALDSIAVALLGAEAMPEKPIRTGQEKFRLNLSIGNGQSPEYKVRRERTAGGKDTLIVTKADGQPIKSPQAFLNELVAGGLIFDPLEFSRMKPAERYETLRRLIGLDFKKHDLMRAEIFDQRTQVNREVKSLESRIESLPDIPDGVPDEELSAAAVLQEQQVASDRNHTNAQKRADLKSLMQEVDRFRTGIIDQNNLISEIQVQIAALNKKAADAGRDLVTMEANLKIATGNFETAHTEVVKLVDEDLAPYQKKLQTFENTNKMVRQKKDKKQLSSQLENAKRKADELTVELEKMDSDKRAKIRDAKYPLPSLSVNESGTVLIDGLPFEQAGTASQYKSSMAIGAALNPKLRFVIIREGSLLDEGSKKTVAQMAQELDLQVFMEVVGTDGDPSIIIEDGIEKKQ